MIVWMIVFDALFNIEPAREATRCAHDGNDTAPQLWFLGGSWGGMEGNSRRVLSLGTRASRPPRGMRARRPHSQDALPLKTGASAAGPRPATSVLRRGSTLRREPQAPLSWGTEGDCPSSRCEPSTLRQAQDTGRSTNRGGRRGRASSLSKGVEGSKGRRVKGDRRDKGVSPPASRWGPVRVEDDRADLSMTDHMPVASFGSCR